MNSAGQRSALVVDDEPELCEILQTILSDLSFSVRMSFGAHGALRQLEILAADIIVTDWSMPDGDGGLLLRAMRDRTPAVPIIVVTAREDLWRTILAEGAFAVLNKPCDFNLLRETIGRALPAR